MRLSRKIQHYNSMETGLSLIISLEQRFLMNSCFMVFDHNNEKIIGLSSASLQLIGACQKLIDTEKKYEDIFILDQSVFSE